MLHHVEERTQSIVCIVLRGHGSRGDFCEIASGSFRQSVFAERLVTRLAADLHLFL